MLDLSVLAKPATIEPWYDIHSKDLKALAPSLRDAHFHSMLHSQRQDYGADLRYIVTKDDVTTFEIDPDAPKLEDFAIPQVGLQTCKEVVFRSGDWRPGEEFVLKSADGQAGIWRKLGGAAVQQVAPPVTTSTPRGDVKRTLDL